MELENKKIEIRNKEIESRKDLAKLKIDAAMAMVEAKSSSSKAVEILKSERKEKTTSVINNNIIINNINIYKQIVLDKFDLDMEYDIASIHKGAMNLFQYKFNEEQYKNWALQIFYESKNGDEIIKKILKFAYRIDKGKDAQCLFYFKVPDFYFGMYIDQCVPDIVQMEYKKEIYPEFSKVLSEFLTKFLEFIIKSGYVDIHNPDTDNFKKIEDINAFKEMSNKPETATIGLKRLMDEIFETEEPEKSNITSITEI